MYTIPPVGTVLPAKENTTVTNPGPVHDPYGLTEFEQADAQDKAWRKTAVMIEDWNARKEDSPEYAAQLGAKPSWAVEVKAAEAGGVYFDLVEKGAPVNLLDPKDYGLEPTEEELDAEDKEEEEIDDDGDAKPKKKK